MGGYGMKREEEIIAEAQKHGLNCMSRINYQDGFIKGAKWADKTMIDKACEWLNQTLYIYTEINHTHCGADTFDWVTSDYKSVSDFIEEFRKVMEE